MANAPTHEPGSVPGTNGRRNGGASRTQNAPTGTPPAVTNTVLHIPSSGDRESRRRKVEEAAYYRAERRGFAPGGDLNDWLEAEKEIEHHEESSERK